MSVPMPCAAKCRFASLTMAKAISSMLKSGEWLNSECDAALLQLQMFVKIRKCIPRLLFLRKNLSTNFLYHKTVLESEDYILEFTLIFL